MADDIKIINSPDEFPEETKKNFEGCKPEEE